MTTLAAKQMHAHAAVIELRHVFGDEYTTDMVVSFDESNTDSEDSPYCEIAWSLSGWTQYSPKHGGEIEGEVYLAAQDWPDNVWMEARDDLVARLWVEV